ncbi:hypothetical protein EBZ37_08670 [bacterium]|nr:hypothetical protein [bacterium]
MHRILLDIECFDRIEDFDIISELPPTRAPEEELLRYWSAFASRWSAYMRSTRRGLHFGHMKAVISKASTLTALAPNWRHTVTISFVMQGQELQDLCVVIQKGTFAPVRYDLDFYRINTDDPLPRLLQVQQWKVSEDEPADTDLTMARWQLSAEASNEPAHREPARLQALLNEASKACRTILAPEPACDFSIFSRALGQDLYEETQHRARFV